MSLFFILYLIVNIYQMRNAVIMNPVCYKNENNVRLQSPFSNKY